ncbi:complement factor H-like isoform X10, partial [Scomber scombrus]
EDKMHIITQICVLFLWMHTVTFVTSQECTLEEFIKSDLYDSNFDTNNMQSSYAEGKQVRVGCNVGFSGFFRLICVRGGWLSLGGKCIPIKCKVDRLEGTTFDPPYKNLFSPGETVRVMCDEKHWVSTTQEVSATPTCQDDGEWTFRPICQEVTCPGRRQPNMEYWDSSWRWSTPTLGDTRRFNCRRGYKSADGDRSVTCTRDGWKPDPACQEITCDREDVPNTDIDGGNKQKYKLNEHVRYVCKDGYEGSFTRTCGENGWNKGWSDGCTEIKCRVEPFRHADIDTRTSEYKSEYKYNEQVDYVCKNGYEGRFTLTCGEARWIGNEHCTSKQCEKLDISNADLIHNEKQSYNHGGRVQYACRDDSNRRFTITCEQGVWTGVQKCEERLGCEPPPVLDHGDVKYTLKSQYNHNEMVEYMCQLYHTMEGEPHRTCINGEWTGQIRCLEPCTLNEDDTRQHNVTLKLSDKKFFLHDEIMQFECAHGVPVGNMAMRQRCNSGVVLLPTCE